LITYQKAEIIFEVTKDFIQEGGLRERMSKARNEVRKKEN
jgi:four helix bundle suffix protein